MLHKMGVGMGWGFSGTSSIRSDAGCETCNDSSDARSVATGSSKAARRLGWARQGGPKKKMKKQKVSERGSSRLQTFELPPPDLPLPPVPPIVAPGYTRRRRGWKGGVKTCRVIVEELRDQLAYHESKEQREEASKQPPEKSDESMDWREALERFRVP